MEIEPKDLFISFKEMTFHPYRHFKIENLWVVLQRERIKDHSALIQDNKMLRDKQQKKPLDKRLRRKVKEDLSLVFANTALQAAYIKNQHYIRDKKLTEKFERNRELQNLLFEGILKMKISDIKKFETLYDPLKNNLMDRRDDCKLVDDYKFYNDIMNTMDYLKDMLNMMYDTFLEAEEKSKSKSKSKSKKTKVK